MITISLCMIVKNEEKVIARCLESIKDLVDEIIIVDTGSTDHTKYMAKKYTHKIFDFVWVDNFSAARNFSYSKATMDYILWLDADDVLLEADRVKFLQLKQSLDPTIDVVMMKYNAGFDEEDNATLSYYRERLTKRSKHFRWHEPVHEYLETSGNIINSDIAITHKKKYTSASSSRNIAIFEKSLAKGIDLSPRGLYYYARELYYHERYDEAIHYFSRFLNTNEGWIEDKISACLNLAYCFQNKQDDANILKALFRSFEYDTPRAEVCCQLGDYYFKKESYSKGKVWYRIASELEKPQDSWGFILHDYWGYYPNIQLSLCYYYLGDLSNAIYYNAKAGEYKPNDVSVIKNGEFYNSIVNKSNI